MKPIRNLSAQLVNQTAEQAPLFGYAIAQLHGIYILVQNAKGLIVVDMHAAHEQIVYEQLKVLHQRGGLATQPLLMPLTVNVSQQEAAASVTKKLLHQLKFWILTAPGLVGLD